MVFADTMVSMSPSADRGGQTQGMHDTGGHHKFLLHGL